MLLGSWAEGDTERLELTVTAYRAASKSSPVSACRSTGPRRRTTSTVFSVSYMSKRYRRYEIAFSRPV